ncbi:MAG: diguanylate cyclase [Candidatus Omnitrophica bacterium]|nr:diguanylate cyclase [Candidatus Omnitrophota bacterium]
MPEKKARILIADDEPSLREIIKTILESENYYVHDVCCGQEAVDAFREGIFDLVILDVNMPDFSGFEVLNKIKPYFEGKYVPIIFLTVSTNIEDKLKALKGGAVDYLTKPVSHDELIARIDNFLVIKTKHDKLSKEVIYDNMTGVLNKDYFLKRVSEETEIANRNRTPVSLIFIDGDRFKNINDTKGHMAGDYVIKEIGQMLKNVIRDVDLIGRFGGDEFVILLPGKGKADLEIVCKRIQEFFQKKPIEYNGQKIPITLSQGAAYFGGKGEVNVNAIVRVADETLYTVKDNGGNGYVIREVNS